MNYLDFIVDDLLEKILDNVAHDIDIQITILNKKLNKKNKNLQYLSITVFEKQIHINYQYVTYCIDKYLFSIFESKKNIVLINIFDDYFGEQDGFTYKSKIMKKPTYFDILVESNKSVSITNDYHHVFLEGLNHIPNYKLFGYSGLIPKRNIEYYEFILCS
jgi:hypothetical protein